jgi:hypothetical protein
MEDPRFFSVGFGQLSILLGRTELVILRLWPQLWSQKLALLHGNRGVFDLKTST